MVESGFQEKSTQHCLRGTGTQVVQVIRQKKLRARSSEDQGGRMDNVVGMVGSGLGTNLEGC